MLINFFKPKPQPQFTEAEALFASAAQREISGAITALLAVAERGCCNPRLPKKILTIAEMLEAEAKVNHNVITTFLSQHEQN